MAAAWTPQGIRDDFPILRRTMRSGAPLVYLDSAATSQKPTQVLQAERDFYERHNAAAHRGSHQLAEEATAAYESARADIAGFVGATPEQTVFTRSATDSLNLIAHAFAAATMLAARGRSVDPRFVLGEGDSIVVTEAEHHANLVPWQELAAKTGAQLRWVGVSPDGRIRTEDLVSVVDARTKLISCAHVSNVLGGTLDIAAFAAAARAVGALFVLDACQSVPHMPVDFPGTGADLAVFSAHKMLGPTGLGVLWGRDEVLEAMPVVDTGGSMISLVTMQESTYLPAPAKFEPGVPSMAQAVGTAAAARYLTALGMPSVHAHAASLAERAGAGLVQLPGVRVLTSPDSPPISAVSFTVDGIHPHDVGQVLDDDGIAVRVGHHCAWPLMRALGVPATVRASFSVYNTADEVDLLLASVERARRFFT